MSNRCVLRRDRKTATEGAEVTCSGRLFQTQASAIGKARSPTVDSRVSYGFMLDADDRLLLWLLCMLGELSSELDSGSSTCLSDTLLLRF